MNVGEHSKINSALNPVAPVALLRPASSSDHGASSVAALLSRADACIDGQGQQQGSYDGSTGAADKGADDNIVDANAEPSYHIQGEGQTSVWDNAG